MQDLPTAQLVELSSDTSYGEKDQLKAKESCRGWSRKPNIKILAERTRPVLKSSLNLLGPGVFGWSKKVFAKPLEIRKGSHGSFQSSPIVSKALSNKREPPKQSNRALPKHLTSQSVDQPKPARNLSVESSAKHLKKPLETTATSSSRLVSFDNSNGRKSRQPLSRHFAIKHFRKESNLIDIVQFDASSKPATQDLDSIKHLYRCQDKGSLGRQSSSDLFVKINPFLLNRLKDKRSKLAKFIIIDDI